MKKTLMKFRISILIVLIIAIPVLIIAFASNLSSFEKTFLANLDAQLSAPNNFITMISDVVPKRDWSQVCFLPPYSIRGEQDRSKLKTITNVDDVSAIKEIPVLSDSGPIYSVLIFTTTKKILRFVKLRNPYISIGQEKLPYGFPSSRTYGEFCMSRETASVSIKEFARGRKILIGENELEKRSNK